MGNGPSGRSTSSTEERTRLILQTANDAFVAIDEVGVIVDWNRAAEVAFGYRADEVIGRRLAETIIPPRLRADHLRGLDRFLATGEQRVLFDRVELPALHRDGHEFPVEATIWPTREPDGSWRFNAFLRDVSERVRLERQGRLLHEVTSAANVATSAEEAVRRTCRAVLEFTGWDVAHTYLPSGPEALRPTGWWEPADGDWAGFRDATAGCTFELGTGLPGRVAASKAPQWIVDVEGDDNFPRQAAAVACGLRSAHAFPVLADDRVTAVLEFYSRTERAPEPELLELMADVGVQLGRVFERQEAQEARSRMIAMIVHELRSPLTAMTGYAELLEDAWDELSEDERLEYVRTVGRQGERLQRFVKDLLTVSRVERQTVDVHPVPVQVADAVDQVLTELDMDQVETSVEEGLAALVDRDHLLQIVSNLLSNAKKYGRPPLTLTATSTSGRVKIAVCDHGTGVPESFVPELFAEFTRAPDVAGKPGTGLGLAIVRRLVEANDGTVEYRPAIPEGPCFTISLREAPAPNPQ